VQQKATNSQHGEKWRNVPDCHAPFANQTEQKAHPEKRESEIRVGDWEAIARSLICFEVVEDSSHLGIAVCTTGSTKVRKDSLHPFLSTVIRAVLLAIPKGPFDRWGQFAHDWSAAFK
jgi:hypothetical protein